MLERVVRALSKPQLPLRRLLDEVDSVVELPRHRQGAFEGSIAVRGVGRNGPVIHVEQKALVRLGASDQGAPRPQAVGEREGRGGVPLRDATPRGERRSQLAGHHAGAGGTPGRLQKGDRLGRGASPKEGSGGGGGPDPVKSLSEVKLDGGRLRALQPVGHRLDHAGARAHWPGGGPGRPGSRHRCHARASTEATPMGRLAQGCLLGTPTTLWYYKVSRR